jgi:hypothetical protein
MIFKQFKDGSCDIEFSFKERLTLITKGKLHLTDENLKKFGDNLIKTVINWQINFNETLQKKLTQEKDIIETK